MYFPPKFKRLRITLHKSKRRMEGIPWFTDLIFVRSNSFNLQFVLRINRLFQLYVFICLVFGKQRSSIFRLKMRAEICDCSSVDTSFYLRFGWLECFEVWILLLSLRVIKVTFLWVWIRFEKEVSLSLLYLGFASRSVFNDLFNHPFSQRFISEYFVCL